MALFSRVCVSIHVCVCVCVLGSNSLQSVRMPSGISLVSVPPSSEGGRSESTISIAHAGSDQERSGLVLPVRAIIATEQRKQSARNRISAFSQRGLRTRWRGAIRRACNIGARVALSLRTPGRPSPCFPPPATHRPARSTSQQGARTICALYTVPSLMSSIMPAERVGVCATVRVY